MSHSIFKNKLLNHFSTEINISNTKKSRKYDMKSDISMDQKIRLEENSR